MSFNLIAEHIAARLTQSTKTQVVIAEVIASGYVFLIFILALIPTAIAHGVLNYILDFFKLGKTYTNCFFFLVNLLLSLAGLFRLLEMLITCFFEVCVRVINCYNESRGRLCILI